MLIYVWFKINQLSISRFPPVWRHVTILSIFLVRDKAPCTKESVIYILRNSRAIIKRCLIFITISNVFKLKENFGAWWRMHIAALNRFYIMNQETYSQTHSSLTRFAVYVCVLRMKMTMDKRDRTLSAITQSYYRLPFIFITTVKHILIECNFLKIIRRRHYDVTDLNQLFKTVSSKRILDFVMCTWFLLVIINCIMVAVIRCAGRGSWR